MTVRKRKAIRISVIGSYMKNEDIEHIRKENSMKKRAAYILLGVFLTGTLLSGCGKNEATEAASESAQTEQEGIGEETEETSVNDENDKEGSETAAAETDKKTDIQETEDTEMEPEQPLEQIAILLPNKDDWYRDAEEFEAAFENDGYEPVILYAEDDVSRQVSQIQQMTEEEVSALIIAPVDAYGLSDVLVSVKENSIPVFSYEDLIMNTDALKYYVTYGCREMGQMAAKRIAELEELDKVQEEQESKTIEFLMGSLDDTQALFFYNGMMEVLLPYLEDGTLICRSGNISFDDTGILRWSTNLVQNRAADILGTYYPDGDAPDIICTGFDSAALSVMEVLEEHGIAAGTEEWPVITGVGCEADAVRSIGEGRLTFSIFLDRRTLADQCETMVNIYLHGEEDPEVNDYEQYDNGIKIIGSYLCTPQLIDQDNYELLIDNGYYSEDEVRPVAAPISAAEPTEEAAEPEENEKEEELPEATPTPKARVTLKRSEKTK